MRETMYTWLDEIWRNKDEQISRMKADFIDNPKSVESVEKAAS
nr:hypothetical protein [Psychrobacter sp. PraFG1]